MRFVRVPGRVEVPVSTPDKRAAAAEPYARMPIGVPGLDEVLHGGLPEHGVYLIKVGTGTGKTTLGLQFLLEGVRRSERVLFVSLSQSNRMLERIAASHGWSLDGVHVHAITPHEILRQQTATQDVFVSDEVELVDIADRIRGVVERSLQVRGHQQLLASASDDLRRAAYFDTLTGLPNRSALYERISTLQCERRGAPSAFAALFVDLNDFKRINDEFGHVAGDEALRLVGAHLVATVRGTDFVARWGGDEFMILLMGTVDAEFVAETIGRLGQGMVLTLQATEEPVMVSFSVGHVEGIAPDLSPDEILALADKRMYEHKHAKRRGADR